MRFSRRSVAQERYVLTQLRSLLSSRGGYEKEVGPRMGPSGARHSPSFPFLLMSEELYSLGKLRNLGSFLLTLKTPWTSSYLFSLLGLERTSLSCL